MKNLAIQNVTNRSGELLVNVNEDTLVNIHITNTGADADTVNVIINTDLYLLKNYPLQANEVLELENKIIPRGMNLYVGATHCTVFVNEI